MNPPPGFHLRLACPLCRSAVYARRGQIGETITCGDCLEEFVVEEPEPPQSPLPAGPEVDDHLPWESSAADERTGPPSSVWSDDDVPELNDHLREEVAPPPAVAGQLTENFEFVMECPLCGTRQDFSDDQIGRRVKCPDCHTVFEVRTPPPRARRRRTPRPDDDDEEEWKLSEPVALPKYQPLVTDLPPATPRQPLPDTPGRGQPSTPAGEAWKKARKHVEQQEGARPKLPDKPLTTGIIGFLFEPNALMRWFGLALALWLEVGAIRSAWENFFSDDPIRQLSSLFLFIFSVPFGVISFVFGSVCMLAIVKDTANGRDKIEDWPDPNFLDWFLDSFYVVVSFFLSVLPGVVIGQVFLLAGNATTIYRWGVSLCVGLTGIVIFPLVLLSTLETGSPVNPASRDVWRSLWLAGHRWAQLFLMSAALAVVELAIWQLRGVDSTLVNFLISLAIVGVWMIYFRLLGRLAWCCQEAVAEAENGGDEESWEQAESAETR